MIFAHFSLDKSGSEHFTPHGSSRGSRGSCSQKTSRSGSPYMTGSDIPVYRVVMLGSRGVGKSSICSQFLSSDHVNTYDSVGKYLMRTPIQLALLHQL